MLTRKNCTCLDKKCVKYYVSEAKILWPKKVSTKVQCMTTNTDVQTVFQETGLHYDRYLREVIEYLEKDPHFREKLKNANLDDIKACLQTHYFATLSLAAADGTELNRVDLCLQQGKLSKELDFVHHNLRTKLDELKREEMNRLRMLIKVKLDMEKDSSK